MPSRKRIVLVAREDSEALISLLRSLPGEPELQQWDDPGKLWDLPRAGGIDLLFLDADLLAAPEIQLVRRIMAGRPGLRVLVSFSAKGAEAAREIRAWGGVPLWKPYLLGELYRLLRSSLEEKAAREPGESSPSLGFVRALADELNNPLATISGYLQLLGLDLGKSPDPDLGEKIAAIREGVQRIAGTVEQLALAAGERKPKKTPLDLAKLLRERFQKNKANLRGVSLRWEGKEKSLPAIGEERLLGVALDSILGFLASLSVPPVEIAASVEAADESTLVLRAPNQKIDSKLFPSLFQPYALDRKGLAVGLRLAAARGIARAHGGDIAASFPAEGAIELRLSVPRE